jgi:hypothetical protein
MEKLPPYTPARFDLKTQQRQYHYTMPTGQDNKILTYMHILKTLNQLYPFFSQHHRDGFRTHGHLTSHLDVEVVFVADASAKVELLALKRTRDVSFFLVQHNKIGEKITKIPPNVQITIKYTKLP